MSANLINETRFTDSLRRIAKFYSRGDNSEVVNKIMAQAHKPAAAGTRWPALCYVPLLHAMRPWEGRPELDGMAVRSGELLALAAWRETKSVYCIDQTLFEELLQTPLDGDSHIPVETFWRLPVWCPYICFPRDFNFFGGKCVGAFVTVETYDTLDALTIVAVFRGEPDDAAIDAATYAATYARPFMLPLVEGVSVTNALAAFVHKVRSLEGKFATENRDAILTHTGDMWRYRDGIRQLLSVVLYLCSTTADIQGRDDTHRLIGKRTLMTKKRRAALSGTDGARMWEVGYRIGARLRSAAPAQQGPDRGGTHASPRAHVRRAHWHAFWTGPKAKVGDARETERALVLKWLHPVLVGAKDGGLVPTAHAVGIQQ